MIKINIKHLIAILWRLYKIVAVGFFTLFCLMILAVIISERFDYIKLPNGTMLVKRAWLDSEIVLLSPSGKEIIDINNGCIIWNDDYVAGDGALGKFIYKVGDKQAKIYTQINMFNYGDYRNDLAKLNMSETSDSHDICKTFWDLDKAKGFRKRFYE